MPYNLTSNGRNVSKSFHEAPSLQAAGYNRRQHATSTGPGRDAARSRGAGARGRFRPRRRGARGAFASGRRASAGVAGGGNGRRHGLHAQARGVTFRSEKAAEERKERGFSRGLLLSWGPSRERRRRQGGALRVGPRLPRGHKGEVVPAEGGTRGRAGRQDKSPRFH